MGGTADLLDALRSRLGEAVKSGDDAQRVVKKALWNGAVECESSALVVCRGVEDARVAISVAAELGTPVAVLAGGHDWAGRAISRTGVTLEISALATVSEDYDEETVTVGGGTTIDQMLAELRQDRAVVTGTISTVGVAGLTLGGGYGKLNNRFGMACDNLIRAEIILSDGSLRTVTERDEPDLFWALRGGGTNFGLVTSLTLATHRLPAVLSGAIFIPLAKSKSGLLTLQRILDDATDDLSVFSALMTSPDGERGLVLGPMWTGDANKGERCFDSLEGLDGAAALARGWSTYYATYDKDFEAAWPKGRGYEMDAHNVARLEVDAIDALVRCATLRADRRRPPR